MARLQKEVNSSYLHPRYGGSSGEQALRSLQSTLRNMSELKPYRVDVEDRVGITTDAPWSMLRAWFRFSDVRWPQEWVTWYSDEQDNAQP